MKAELNIPQEVIDAIADRVLEKLVPMLQSISQPDQYLNVDEVAMMLGKSKEQIYQWVDRSKHGLGDFPFYKAGRSLRFLKKEIESWVKKQ